MSHQPAVAGVPVTLGPVPPRPPAAWGPHRHSPDGRLYAAPRWALLDIEGVGRFHIRDGDQITLAPHDDATGLAGPRELVADLWLHGTVAVLLAGQRGRFILHASVVDLGGRAVAVTGRPGAGTTTTALALWRGGAGLLTDDTSLIVPPSGTPQSPATVVPTGRALHARPDSLARLGLSSAAIGTVPDHEHQLLVPLAPSGPRPLHAAVVLHTGASPSVRLTPVADLAVRARLLGEQVRQRSLVEELWPDDLARWTASVARAVPLWRLDRPSAGWTAEALADEVRWVAAAGDGDELTAQPVAGAPPS
jgi:hypothetical protein